ncbi:MAG: tetratricopeptide repeat protein [Gemmatimonadetes bacterium]|nr:tetratricopeptide repeat protein [Gemmatimonadota bacterium]MSR35031.1 tetratricopeptide repeat protein [Gemmatimonadota bacterium]
MCHFWCGRHAEAQKELDEGLATAERSGDRAAAVRLRISKAHCLQELGRGKEALETLSLALPVAEALGEPGLLARVHRALALLCVWIGPPAESRAHAERSRQVGDVSIEFWARWGLAVLDGMRGDTARMATSVEEVNDLAERARVLPWRVGQGDRDRDEGHRPRTQPQPAHSAAAATRVDLADPPRTRTARRGGLRRGARPAWLHGGRPSGRAGLHRARILPRGVG